MPSPHPTRPLARRPRSNGRSQRFTSVRSRGRAARGYLKAQMGLDHHKGPRMQAGLGRLPARWGTRCPGGRGGGLCPGQVAGGCCASVLLRPGAALFLSPQAPKHVGVGACWHLSAGEALGAVKVDGLCWGEAAHARIWDSELHSSAHSLVPVK